MNNFRRKGKIIKARRIKRIRVKNKDGIRAERKPRKKTGLPPAVPFKKGNFLWAIGKKSDKQSIKNRQTHALIMGLNNKGIKRKYKRKVSQKVIDTCRKRFIENNPLWDEKIKDKWKKSHKRWGRFKNV